MSHIEGLEKIASRLQKAVETERSRMDNRLDEAGTFIYNAVKKRVSYTDHPQWQLTMMGSPYSTRYDTDNMPHYDDSKVHIQTGILSRNIEKVTEFGELESSVAVGVDANKTGDYIEEVIDGAPKVRPRPFLQRAFWESKDGVESIMKGGG